MEVELFGPYRLDELIGRGGMGEVYRAFDTKRNRAVALKRMPVALGTDAEFVARFRREAAIAARLQAPHVVPIHDYGDIDGRLFIDMRLVSGTDLTKLLAGDGPLDPARAVNIVTQVASALDDAHTEGLAHRDVKPSNVLLTGNDFAYLTDFGVVRALSGGTAVTVTGATVGTLAYMAPERFLGQPGDHLADVYALGCVLYEALTGRPPFGGNGLPALMYAHVHQDPPQASTQQQGVPAALDEVIARGMAKDPRQRFATAGQLASAASTALRDPVNAAPRNDRPAGESAIVRVPTTTDTAPGPARDPRTRQQPTPPAAPTKPLTTTPAPSPPPQPAPPTPQPPAPLKPSPTPPPKLQFTPLFKPQPTPPPAAPLAPQPAALPKPSLKPQPTPPPGGRPPGNLGGASEPDDGDRRDDGFRRAHLDYLSLRSGFRFITNPLSSGDPVPFLDNQPPVDMLRERIQHSAGGAILVTGFTGVGKTTVVNRALAELRDALAQTGESEPLVEVRLDVARPISADELLIKLIRNVYEALRKTRVLDRLTDSCRDHLELAYLRTSQSLKKIRTKTSERSSELGLGYTGTGLFKFGSKRTEGSTVENGFLKYDFADIEHDFLRIVEGIGSRGSTPPRGRQLLRWRRRPGQWAGRLVIVIDELDKLIAEPGGEDCLRNLLTGMKNVFSATDVQFIFVAGPDMFDLVRAANGCGSSVYDGIFGITFYVPLLSPGAARTLMSVVVAEGTPLASLDGLCDYLEYRSRGLPRQLLSALYELVTWRKDVPILVVGDRKASAVTFFAELHRKLMALRPLPRGPLTESIDVDRYRMGAYLLTDWALHQGNKTFSLSDINADPDVRPDRRIVSDELIRELLEALANDRVGILEHWATSTSSSTLLDVTAPAEPVYRLASSVQSAAARSGETPADLGCVDGGRYALLKEMSRSKLGRTYHAFDERYRETVVVKLLDIPGVAENARARQRFEREAMLANSLRHPGLADGRGVIEEPDGRLGLVMDFVEGEQLSRVLERSTLAAPRVASIARDLVDLLNYLDGKGVMRLDLKPSNIVLRSGVAPVVIDLGLARRLDEWGDKAITEAGVIIGTPRYAAPEQLRGEPVDIRADLYSLGLILYEALAGVPARSGQGDEVLCAARDERIDPSGLPCSPQMRKVLARLLEPSPDQRFPDPASVAEAIADLPETRN